MRSVFPVSFVPLPCAFIAPVVKNIVAADNGTDDNDSNDQSRNGNDSNQDQLDIDHYNWWFLRDHIGVIVF